MAAYENTIEGLCQRVFARLGDTTQTAWDKCQVETAVNDALWMLSVLRRELFVEEVDIELAPGLCVQTLPESCNALVSFSCVEVNGVRTPVTNGNFDSIQSFALHPPSRRTRCQSRNASGFVSTTVANYQVAVSPDNPRAFAVSPTVAEGDVVKLIAECVSLEDFQTDPCKPFSTEVIPYMIPITELALYQLYSSDREAPEVAAMALASLQAFTSLTAISQGAVNAVLQQQTGG